MLDTARPESPAPLQVTDLRGRSSSAAAPAVLADPTGARARRLRLVGRTVGSIMLLWLCGLVLAGLGLLPLADIPLGSALQPAAEPGRLGVRPTPRQPARSDLSSATPLAGARASSHARSLAAHRAAAQAAAGARRAAAANPGRSGGQGSGKGSGSVKHPATGSTTSSPTGSSTTSSTGSSTAAIRSHGANGRGRGSRGSGTTATPSGTTTAPGSSGTAPGHDPNRTTGHGKKPTG